jgi:hypothetical protein
MGERPHNCISLVRYDDHEAARAERNHYRLALERIARGEADPVGLAQGALDDQVVDRG